MQGIIRLRLKRDYEKDGVLRDLDKWCVVEWPKNFQHGYDVDIREGQICKEAHISLNAYYIAAVRTANKMASVLGMAQYRDEAPLLSAFYTAFYDKQKNLFRDVKTRSISAWWETVLCMGLIFVPKTVRGNAFCGKTERPPLRVGGRTPNGTPRFSI